MTNRVDCTNRVSFESAFINSWKGWDEMDTSVFYFYQCELEPNFAALTNSNPGSKFDVLIDLGKCVVELYDTDGEPVDGSKKKFKLVVEDDKGVNRTTEEQLQALVDLRNATTEHCRWKSHRLEKLLEIERHRQEGRSVQQRYKYHTLPSSSYSLAGYHPGPWELVSDPDYHPDHDYRVAPPTALEIERARVESLRAQLLRLSPH